MASNKAYFTDLRYLVQDKVRADRLILDGKEYFQAVYNGKKVFNRALYSIEAFETLIPASGTTDMKKECLVDSIKTDFDGTEYMVDYTISPEFLQPNDSTEEWSGVYTVTQIGSGLKTTGMYRQGGNVLIDYQYMGLKVTSVVYEQAPASGGFIAPVVTYSGTRVSIYSNGDRVSEPWGSNTSVLLSATGRPLVKDALFDTVGGHIGQVYAPDLGTNESGEREVAEITSLTIEAVDGSILYWSGTAYAYQLENIKETEYSSPDIAATYTDIGADGSAAVLTIGWEQVRTESYSSGADPVVTHLSGTIDNAATSGNRITMISGTRHLDGASLVSTVGSASRGNITAVSLGYTETDRTKAYEVYVEVLINGMYASRSVAVYQETNVVSSYYTEPQITSVTAGDVGADGSAASISVVYTQNLVTESTAVPSGRTKDVGGTAVPYMIDGETVSGNGKASGADIVADSLGVNEMPRSVVYQVLSVSIMANGETGLWSGELDVWQEANTVVSAEYGHYMTSVQSSATTMVSEGGDAVITVGCTRDAAYTYTSGSMQESEEDATSTLETTRGKLSVLSITGYGTSVLSIPENTGSASYVIVTVSDPDGGKKQVYIRQDAVRYEFLTMSQAAIGSLGGELSLSVTSTRNGKEFGIDSTDVSVSGLDGAHVDSVVPLGEGEFNIIVFVPGNPGTVQRTFTITATQPGSGEKIVWEAVQSGASQAKRKVGVICKAEFSSNTYGSVSYDVSFDASDTDAYTGGTISNVYIQLSTENDGTGTVIDQHKLYDSLQVQSGTSSRSKIGILANSTGSSTVYVLVYYDNKLQYRSMPEVAPGFND